MAEIPVIPVSGQNEPLPFEQAPGRVVFVPYRSTATAQAGAGVDYTFDLPQAATGLLRDTDLVPLEPVRYPSNQGQTTGLRKFEYKGSLLVDEKNRISRPQYDVRSEPLGLLRSLKDNATRRQYLNTLYQKGFYQSGKPSVNGLSQQDQAAMGNLLEYANSMGRTWNVAFTEVSSLENERGLGGAAAIRYTAREDVRDYANRDSLELLGRTLSRQEFRQALQLVRERERQAALGSEQAPSLGSITRGAVQQVAGREVQLNDAADAIDVFRQMLRGA